MRLPGNFTAALAIVLAGGAWYAYARDAAPTNVVVITLDTVRIDRLSPYGFMNVSLPHLERLAREGVVFDEATSPVPLTLPAHTSIFTGLLPPHHGVRDNAGAALPDSQTTLAEVLKAHGFRTGAFVGSMVLDPERGLKQGFDEYVGIGKKDARTPEERQRRAGAVIDDATQWLGTVGESPFFLWTHIYDAHQPYDPPEPYRTTYGHNPYVGEIAYADSQIGRLIDALERRHLLDRTAIIVVGDHGESLGEHGERDHGIFLYENVIRVPFIVRAPSVRPNRIGEVVRLTDVMPTVLDLLHVPAPPTDGVSLVDLMRGRAHNLGLEAYSESMYPERFGWSSLRAIRDGQYKFIAAPRPELYDLYDDPFEERNIYETRRATAQKLTNRIDLLKASQVTTASTSSMGAKPVTDTAMQASLEALGYLASAPPPATLKGQLLPDPKDCMKFGLQEGVPSRAPCEPRADKSVRR